MSNLKRRLGLFELRDRIEANVVWGVQREENREISGSRGGRNVKKKSKVVPVLN
jgi:hypothetical protein